MITAVIFDLDGTLVDSAPDIQVMINKRLAQRGRHTTDLTDHYPESPETLQCLRSVGLQLGICTYRP